MMDRHLEELIHRELDGDTTPAESERLREALAADPEARRLYERLGELGERLAGVDLVDPPEELAQEIRRALGEPSSPPREGALPGTRSAFTPWPRRLVRQAVLFAAGLALGFAIHQILQPEPGFDPEVGRDFLVGTIGAGDRDAEWPLVEETPLAATGLEGRVEIRRRGPRILVDATFRTARELQVRWEYDPAALRLEGLSTHPASLEAARVENARIAAPQPEGEGAHRLLLRVQDDQLPPSLSLRIEGEGVLLQRSFDIRPENTR